MEPLTVHVDGALASVYGTLAVRAVGYVPALHRGELDLTRRQDQRGAPNARQQARCVATLPAIWQGGLDEVDDAVDGPAERVSRDPQIR